MKLETILKDVNYTLIKGKLDVEINDIKYESQKVEAKDVYVAIKGFQANGHDYIPEAVSRGAKVIVIQELVNIIGDDLTIILVNDSRVALANLARNYFGRVDEKLYLIGITGTTGKTTTSHIIYELLNEAGYKCGLIGSNGIKYNDKILPVKNTTPESYVIYKSLEQMQKEGITHVVIEASSQSFKMHRLEGLTFRIGALTNLTNDHISLTEHLTHEEYLDCKKELLKNSKEIIINNDSLDLDYFLKDIDKPLVSYALNNEADLKVTNLEFLNETDDLITKFTTKGLINEEFLISLPGEFNVYNTLCALAVLQTMKVDVKSLKTKLRTIKVEGRMEVIVKNDLYKVIIDYAHNEDSLAKLVLNMQAYHPKRLISIFGGGGNRAVKRRLALGRIIGASSDLCILTMDNPRFEEISQINEDIKKGLNEVRAKYLEINDRKYAIIYALDHALEGDIILLIGKGSEEYQDIKGTKYYFNEKEIIKEYLKEKEAEDKGKSS